MKSEAVGVIYKITNLVNGKVYIGQTINSIKERWRGHCKISKGRTPTPIQLAIRKWGRGNFKIEEIYVAFSTEILDLMEVQLIKDFDCMVPLGYNLYSGGNKNKKASLDTRQKQSIANTKHPVVSIRITDGVKTEYLNLIDAQKQTGVDYRNIFAQCSGKPYSKSFGGYMWFFKGQVPKNPAYVNNARAKAVCGIEIATGKILRFESTQKAETEGGFLRKEVSLACRGLKFQYRGFVWSYLTNPKL